MSVIGSNALAGASGQGAGGFVIEKSIRFEGGVDASLTRTPTTAGSSSAFTLSTWVKRSLKTTYEYLMWTTTSFYINFTANDKINIALYAPDGSSWAVIATSQAMFRDPSAWYHIVVSVDSSAGTTNADRLKLWVNGVETPLTYSTYWGGLITGNIKDVNTTIEHEIGSRSGYDCDLYLADYHWIDGQALDHTSFGEFDDNGVWQAKEFTGDHSFTPTVTYPAVYVSSPGAYGAVTDVNTVNGNVFTSAGSAGAGSIKVEFASAITGVTHVKFKGGGYSANAGFSIKVNGSTTHSSLTTNSSYTVRTETLSSATDITSFEIVSASDGWALGDLQFSTDGTNFTAPSGTATVIPDSGVNGFHLDFADGNNIGNDAAGSNNWTANNLSEAGGTVNYVDSISGSPSNPYNAFSTSYISNYVNTSTWAITNTAWTGAWDSSGNTNVFTPSGGIAVSSSLIVYYGNYSNSAVTTTLTITYTDSSTETNTFTSGNNNWMGSFTASNAAGKTIQSIQVAAPGSWNYQSFGGFVIDGQILTSANPDTDVLPDSPTNGNTADDTGAGGEVSANYCTMNPLANYLTLANGNLDVSQSSAAHHTSYATLGVSSGKWYWEITKNDGNNASATSIGLGVAKTSFTSDSSTYISSTDTIIGYMQSGVGLYDGDGYSRLVTALGSGVEHTTGTWMLAFDFDNGKGWIGKDGTWLSDTTAGNEGNPATGANPSFNGFVSGETYVPMVGMYAATSVSANFGQRAWKYTAPSGFKALCTANLPTPDVPDGSVYLDVKTWDGNGSTQSITGYEFSPDLVWIKKRSGTSDHALFDTIRGATKRLYPNDTSGQDTLTDTLTAFNSDGFSLGNANDVNQSSQTYVGWAWDAGSSTASNTDGDVTSSVRANQTAGFSIVKWTAPTWNGGPQSVGHGLNAAPSFIAAKVINDSGSWYCYHKSLDASNPEDKYISLNDSSAAGTLADSWGTSAPSSTTFGDRLLGWAGGKDVIAYCMSPVAGYSAFGSYIGNGSSTDGTFVFTNFRPSLIVVKRAYGTGNWHAFDTTRDADNRAENGIYWNLSSAETVVYFADINSNGFKLRTSNAELNGNGDTYIYLAFAEHPFQANGGLAR